MTAFLLANMELIFFYFVGGVAVLSAIGVVAFRHPVHAALSLLMTFLSVAGLFILLHAEFLAAVQILVYAGGIMVLFLFVIMLVNVRMLPTEPQYLRRLAPWAIGLAVLLAGLTGAGMWATSQLPIADPVGLTTANGQVLGNTGAVSWSLYVPYLLPFEIVSLVLLVAMIGAIVMGRKERAAEEGH
jgi:NADH-quinone oxidoreductase subunit J